MTEEQMFELALQASLNDSKKRPAQTGSNVSEFDLVQKAKEASERDDKLRKAKIDMSEEDMLKRAMDESNMQVKREKLTDEELLMGVMAASRETELERMERAKKERMNLLNEGKNELRAKQIYHDYEEKIQVQKTEEAQRFEQIEMDRLKAIAEKAEYENQ